MRPGGTSWERDIYPTVSRMLTKGGEYADKGQYIGYPTGCIVSSVVFAATIAGIPAACAGGMVVGGELGYIIGGGVGIIVGLF